MAACSGWSPARPFEREAPPVREAVAAFDAGDAASAALTLEEYLSTGACRDGSIGTPDILKRRPDGTFDLALSLFRIGEQFGRRFGDEEETKGATEALHAQRHAQVICAKQVAEAISDAPEASLELRARATYLAGNLAFLDGEYEDAVRAYDRSLVLSPGEMDGGDAVGRDAAWNRAIALRRIEDKKDAGNDASRDASGDAAQDASGGDSGRGDDGGREADGSRGRPDGGDDDGRDAAQPPPPPPDGGDRSPDAGAPPPLSNEDERMLDQLENAPTLQQEEAKRSGKRRVKGAADR
jgi:hypothetical protein